MNPDNPYLRRVELLIGPLAEWRGGGNVDEAVQIISDGTPNTLRVKFSIRAHIVSTATPTIITVYNLSKELRNSLQRADVQVVIRAGWANLGVLTVFTGSLLAAVNHREGPDIVTVLTALSGYSGLNRAVISQSIGPGTALGDLVKTIAKSIPGITVDPKFIRVPSIKVGSQGLSFAGPAKEWLDKLARTYGFNWWIEKGSFKAISDLAALAGSIVEINPDNGFLLRAEPILYGPMQQQSGVMINSLFNSLIEVGSTVRLRSGINPKLDGDYPVYALLHSGDTGSSNWTTTTETWWGYGS